MEQDEVIRRLKGLGKGSAPAAPNFTAATQPIPLAVPAASRTSRWGVAPIAAAVAVLALATAGLALPKGGPLRQVLASDDTTETTEVEQDDSAESAVPDPCETMPVAADEGDASATPTEEELAAREQKAQAWAEWRAQNCSDPAQTGVSDDAPDAEDDDADEADDDSDDADDDSDEPKKARDEACTGPPPHANNPGNGDPNRTDAEREAQKREWQEWHRQNCTSSSGNGADDDGGRPEDKPKAEAQGSGHEKGRGEGHGPNDENHQDRGAKTDDNGADDNDNGADDNDD